MLEIDLNVVTPEQEKLLNGVGLTTERRQMILDLARHAAKNSVFSIQTVANTAPDDAMVNSVVLTAMTMVGQAAAAIVAENVPKMLDGLPPDLREAAEGVLQQQRKFVAPEAEPKPVGARDFDGNYR